MRIEFFNIKSAVFKAMLLIIFILQLFIYTWCRVQSIKVGYDITTETERYHRLSVARSNLQIELARLKSPARIGKIAANLGLSTPNSEQIIIIP